MKTRNFIFGIVASLCLATSAMAEVNTSGLSDDEVAKLELQAAQMKADKVSGTSQVEKINQYVQIGQGVGAGLASAAKEMNTAVNDFAKTPVGQMTTAVIIYKVLGRDFVHYICGFLWFTTTIPIWLFFFNKSLSGDIFYDYEYPEGTNKRIKRKTIEKNRDVAGTIFSYWLIFGILTFIGMLTTFS